jgi:predicted Fe-Mo cluster-binding NifX family protein
MNHPKRIGLTLLHDSEDSPLSDHFGKAKWLGIYEPSTGEMRFVRNTGLNGRFVADAFDEAGCSHVVFTNIGEGALGHLGSYEILAVWGPAGIPAKSLVQDVESGRLPAGKGTPHVPEHHHRRPS